MNANRTLPATIVALVACTSVSALANPHRVTSMPRSIPPMHTSLPTTFKRIAPPQTVHVHVLPVPPQWMPAFGGWTSAFGFAPGFGSGFGFGSALGLGSYGLGSSSCSSAMPKTLGDLGFAPASSFAPVALGASQKFDALPSGPAAMSAQSFCQPPALDGLSVDLGRN